MKLEKLFSPIKIGNFQLKNRMVVSSMSPHFCENGLPTEQYIRYHEAKARGGWGLVFTEDIGIMEDASTHSSVSGLWCDEMIPAHAEFVRRVHEAGGTIGAQIYHAGREKLAASHGTPLHAPSAIKAPVFKDIPLELTVEEIHEIEEAFGDCALRAKKAGYDIVEIHGAHGYLVDSFMSSFSNKRFDEYGGTLENRMRFPLEVIANIRKKVGPDYPLSIRISTQEYVDGGLTLQESKLMAMAFEEAGVDVIHCSQAVSTSKQYTTPPTYVPFAYFIENTAAIKSAVSIPVIAVGRINDVFMAESLLRQGKCDLVTMARSSLADPEMPNKAAEGRTADILHCIGCCQGCAANAGKGTPIDCLVNPLLGHEVDYDLTPVASPKKVIVAGAGVAGLNAAQAAAMKGHNVTVYEAAKTIGGQWIAAAIPPGKSEYTSLLYYLNRKLGQLGVEIKLNCPLTREIVEAEKPDAVIVATGGTPFLPPIKGLNTSPIVHTAFEILLGKTYFGKNVVVVGGGLVGAETAAFLGQETCNVTIIEMMDEIITDAVAGVKVCLTEDLNKFGVSVHTGTKLVEVGDNYVIAEKNGSQIRFDNIDTVVAAMGIRPYNTLESELQGCGCKVVSVGDAAGPKDGYKNIREGFVAGLNI